jgi:hypothetical protein
MAAKVRETQFQVPVIACTNSRQHSNQRKSLRGDADDAGCKQTTRDFRLFNVVTLLSEGRMVTPMLVTSIGEVAERISQMGTKAVPSRGYVLFAEICPVRLPIAVLPALSGAVLRAEASQP